MRPTASLLSSDFLELLRAYAGVRHSLSHVGHAGLCLWDSDAPFVTIIGLYSNVEGGLDARGRIDPQTYLQQQLANADKNKKLFITVHHPPFRSIPRMAAPLTSSTPLIEPSSLLDARRTPSSPGTTQLPAIFQGHQRQAGSLRCSGAAAMRTISAACTSSRRTQTSNSPKTTHADVLSINMMSHSPVSSASLSAPSRQIEYFRVPFDDSEPDKDPFDTFTV